MLKFLVYVMLLWQGMCTISAENQFSDTGPEISDIPCNGVKSMANNEEGSTLGEWNPDMLKGSNSYRAKLQVFNVVGSAAASNKIYATISDRCCHKNLNSDYVATNEKSAFKLHLRKLPWNVARRICVQEGGHLAVIRTDSEETEILKMMLADSVDDAWLGIHDQFEEDDWITVLGEPLGKTGWARWSKLFPNNPDNYNGKQHCARLVRNGGGMDDEACELPKSFVCQISTS